MNKTQTNINMAYNLIVVLGPTATGKTQFAANLALKLDGEIISADSRQVYRRMNLGTGKDYNDYQVGGSDIPYHLIDIVEPGEKYNVYKFQHDFISEYSSIIKRGKKPILCGGTGLYIESVTKSYKLVTVPENHELRHSLKGKSLSELEIMLTEFRRLHNTTDTDTIERAVRAIEIEDFYARNPKAGKIVPEIYPVYIGIQCDRFIRRNRITQRLHSRLESGMVEEVRSLINEGIKAVDLLYYGLEYKYITMYLMGELDYTTMVERLNTAIHQFAKRQMTWFRKMEREGAEIFWIDSEFPLADKIDLGIKYLASLSL
jgi:tRNA dimethylallyltransferase